MLKVNEINIPVNTNIRAGIIRCVQIMFDSIKLLKTKLLKSTVSFNNLSGVRRLAFSISIISRLL